MTIGGEIVTSDQVAQSFQDELKVPLGCSIKLVAFLANQDSFALTYANWTMKSCAKIGIEFELRTVSGVDLEDCIIQANDDSTVNGIIVYYPVFGGSQDQYIQNLVDPIKDVEGLSHIFRYNLYHNKRTFSHLLDSVQFKCILPCTPLAIVKILEYLGAYGNGHALKGKTVTIINRSEIVGRPLAALLAHDGAHVYSVDINGILEFHPGNDEASHHRVSESIMPNVETCLFQSNIIITGVPSADYSIDLEAVRNPSIKDKLIVNFSSYKNVPIDPEDYDFDLSQYGIKAFVPSIGKVTICMLQRNLIRLATYQNQLKMAEK